MFDDVMYRPKLLSKAPSMRAVKTYNDIVTEYDDNRGAFNLGDDNLAFVSDTIHVKENNNNDAALTSATTNRNYNHLQTFENKSLYGLPLMGHIFTTDEMYDYPTIRSSSIGTNTFLESDIGIDRKDELGSTTILVPSKIRMVS